MISVTILLISLSVCLAATTVTVNEDTLRSLIQPLIDFSQSPKASAADMPSLFASLAAAAPLDSLALGTSQKTQISPANQQLAQLNLAGITNLVKTALGAALHPSTETAPPVVNPLFGNPSGAGAGVAIPNIFPSTIPNSFPNTIPSNFPNTNPNSFPNTYPRGGFAQPAAAPVPARRNNIFNPLSFLFSGLGGGGGSGPFGMMNMSMMMRMMDGLMEAFF